MRRITSLVGLLFALFAASAASAHHHGHWGGLSVNFRNDGEPRTCADLEVDADGREVSRAEQKLTLAQGSAPFEVQAQTNSGVVITGWEGGGYEVSVCKVAIDNTSAAADARLAEIDVRLEGRRLVTHGPNSGEWLAYLLIKTPRGAAMDLGIDNGPLSLTDASGKFSITGENGPVSLRRVSGNVSVALQNGPVSVDGGGGSVRVRTENGPISVHLQGGDWEGEGLDASAVNGPLALDLDDSFKGGVVVESSEHAPWSCGSLCRGASRTWDDHGRRVEFGHAPARVKLSTENGPVAIGDR